MTTSMQAAFQRAGGPPPRDVRFRTAIAEFRNNDGLFDEALSLLREAYGLVVEGLPRRASNGYDNGADHPTPKGDGEGLPARADKAKEKVPDPSPTPREGEAAPRLPQGQPPFAEPSPSQAGRVLQALRHARRGASAIAAVQPTMRKTLFDTVHLPGDGRAIGDITWKELEGLARRHAEAYRLLALINGYGQPADMDAPVRDVLKEETLRQFVEIARLANVH